MRTVVERQRPQPGEGRRRITRSLPEAEKETGAGIPGCLSETKYRVPLLCGRDSNWLPVGQTPEVLEDRRRAHEYRSWAKCEVMSGPWHGKTGADPKDQGADAPCRPRPGRDPAGFPPGRPFAAVLAFSLIWRLVGLANRTERAPSPVAPGRGAPRREQVLRGPMTAAIRPHPRLAHTTSSTKRAQPWDSTAPRGNSARAHQRRRAATHRAVSPRRSDASGDSTTTRNSRGTSFGAEFVRAWLGHRVTVPEEVDVFPRHAKSVPPWRERPVSAALFPVVVLGVGYWLGTNPQEVVL